MQRPQGVTILAVLAAIGGVLGLFGAIALFGLGALGAAITAAGGGAATGFMVGGFAVFWALVSLVQAGASLGFAYGAWFLKPWAWMLGVGMAGLGILIALVNLIGGSSNFFSFLLSVAVSGAIIYYLFRPEIKKVFGRA